MKHISLVVLFFCSLVMLSGCVPPKRNIPAPGSGSFDGPTTPGGYQTETDYLTGQSNVKAPAQPGSVRIPSDGSVVGQIQQQQAAPFAPSMAYINDRIFEYGRKLDQWKKMDEESLTTETPEKDAAQMVQCFKDLQRALNGYTRLREEMMQQSNLTSSPGIQGERFFELQKRDINFLESNCGKTLGGTVDRGAGWQERQETADLSQLETLIDRYSSSQEYEEVVQVWLQIPEAQVDRIGLRAKIAYGNALMFLHQEEKAAEVYQQIVDEMSSSKEQSTDLISLRKVLADLYTAAGNYLLAEKQYGKISDDYTTMGGIEEWSKLQLFILERSQLGSPELAEYSSLMRNYLGFIPEQDGYKIVWQADKFLEDYPYTAVSSNVDMIRADAQQQADEWFNGFLAVVTQLTEEKKYEEGLELLETIPDDIISNDKQQELKEKSDEIILEEAVNRETEKLARMQELQRQWNSGILLMEAGDYESAIGVFISLLDSEYSAKASEKIEEVSLTAARAERRKAANVFSRFTKTNDIESKKALLVECRKILRDILVKYPEVDIADKVIGNLKRVEREMNLLDPGLLPQLIQEEEAERQSGSTFNAMAPLESDPFLIGEPVEEATLDQ